jgi:hypothetical protein
MDPRLEKLLRGMVISSSGIEAREPELDELHQQTQPALEVFLRHARLPERPAGGRP